MPTVITPSNAVVCLGITPHFPITFVDSDTRATKVQVVKANAAVKGACP